MTGGPIILTAETSAGSFFDRGVGSVRDIEGKTHKIDHVKYLEEAEKKILQAVARATNSAGDK
jgi:hypothetical protein